MASAQLAPLNSPTMSGAIKAQYERQRDYILRAADKVPETDYSFRPTDEVRTFGQIVGHVADEQYLFCSAALGEESPGPGNLEKTQTSKAALIAGLKAAFAYCDAAYAGMTDAKGAEVVRFFGGMPRLAALAFNTSHNAEHYGNMVTYMRLRHIIPPSSERLPRTAK
jgi:uncharacterized damage-inducible protein DinB